MAELQQLLALQLQTHPASFGAVAGQLSVMQPLIDELYLLRRSSASMHQLKHTLLNVCLAGVLVRQHRINRGCAS